MSKMQSTEITGAESEIAAKVEKKEEEMLRSSDSASSLSLFPSLALENTRPWAEIAREWPTRCLTREWSAPNSQSGSLYFSLLNCSQPIRTIQAHLYIGPSNPPEKEKIGEQQSLSLSHMDMNMAVAAMPPQSQGASFLTKQTFQFPITTFSLLLPATNRNRKPLFLFSTQLSSPVTSKKDEQRRLSFTIDYLVDSCGLSPEYAIAASRKLLLDSPERPNTVVKLLREHGFSTAQISSLVKKRPVLLLANAQSVLLPKLRFFLSIGVSKSLLARTLSSDPTILTRSLLNQLIPSYNFLKSVLYADDKIVAALRRTTWVFLEDHTKNLVPNINFMSETGVPEKCIQLLLTHFPEAVMQKNQDFRGIAKQAKEMGFDPKKSTFVLAIHALSGKGNKSIWDKCFQVYHHRWGWSEDDILCAFKKHPHCMMLSERKINRTMEFLVKEVNLAPRSIAQCPVVLFFSLEKRIIPRCSVIKVLAAKGMVKEDWSLTSLLVPVEKVFLEKLVIKYEEELPELMDVYRGYTKLLTSPEHLD
ncbi:unnamed protein product [Microthlaspi erraticum]|uniref:Uncharacterized protein n=1 Tax=Microthlaspi erraticum TaxID=1685480 RepID=A0A6D2K7E9_9BRAS|nr:unnamed protein product [Microthlaspi erraticum]